MNLRIFPPFALLLLCSCIPIISEHIEMEVPQLPDEHQIHSIPIQHEAYANIPQQEPVALVAIQSCSDISGTIRTEKKPPNQAFNVCILPNGHQCEEQSLLDGTCPQYGINPNNYATPAARYCALTGGIYKIKPSTGEEQGTCTRHGNTCDVWELWNGKCQ